MLPGDIKTIKMLDEILSRTYKTSKDSSKDTDCGVYTKTYEIPSENPHPVMYRVRIWFNENTGKGSIKVRKVSYPLLTMLGTYTLLQAGILIQQVVVTPK